MAEELAQMRRKSTEKIERLTEELKQTKQSKTESVRQIERMREEQTQMRRESTEKIERLTEKLKKIKQYLDLTTTESANEIEKLKAELKETNQQLVTSREELRTAKRDLEVTKKVLIETKQDRDITSVELKQYQLDFAKESKALKEILHQTREVMFEIKRKTVEDESSIDSEETRSEDASILAAEFGRLTVAIAEYLTLDHCLKLAILFNVPPSDCDTLLRVSLIESPGLKLLDLLNVRNIINMYDVTNLQKGLTMLHLEAVNNDLVVPYQESIDDSFYELHKAKKMFTWEEVATFINAVKDDTARRQMRYSETLLENDAEPYNTSQTEATAHQFETREEDRGSVLRGRHHQLYVEDSIGREGGTIQLAGVSLTVPPDALHESHVIALTVMSEALFALDRADDVARITPLIKLEPLGLMFKKSLHLSIPHSAFITEPDNQSVIIYSGQISTNIEDPSDSITWTEDRFIPRQLTEKSVKLNIQCLSYLSASIVSQTTAPHLYIVRAVPFVDGVRNADDDIILTVCLCRDNDAEYNMLLSDYKTKLPLEQYSTLQLRRHSERDENDEGFLHLTVASANNAYMPYAVEAMKRFAISHFCTASRVSHQFRLQKNQDVDRDVVEIVLTFSQAEYKTYKIFLRIRIKDLIISQECEDLLTGTLPLAIKPYEELKANISLMLENHHCSKLAIYFELSPAETDKVQTDAAPGRILMKILDEREKIMPGKMIGLFNGLKACHLDKIAQMVLEYIYEYSKWTQQERRQQEERNVKGISNDASVSQRLSQQRQIKDLNISKESGKFLTSFSAAEIPENSSLANQPSKKSQELDLKSHGKEKFSTGLFRQVAKLFGNLTEIISNQKMVIPYKILANIFAPSPAGMEKVKYSEPVLSVIAGNELISLQTSWKLQTPARTSDQSVQTEVSSSGVSSVANVKTLTEEGFTEQEVIEALDISRNRLAVARKILQCLGENLVTQQDMLFRNERVITQRGGTITIPDTEVVLEIPPDALPDDMENCLVKMRIIPGKVFDDPDLSFSSHCSVVVEILPNNIRLLRPAVLNLPHCLTLKTVDKREGKIFISHHTEGDTPHWKEQTDLEYSVEDKYCKIWLDRFCWVLMKINEKDVLAKKLVLYTCGKKLIRTDEYAEINVGYYLDKAGEAEFLQLNKGITLEQSKQFLFMKDGKQPLCLLLLEETVPEGWKRYTTGKNPQEIFFQTVADLLEYQCLFLLQKVADDAGTPICVIEASQELGQQPAQLSICFKYAPNEALPSFAQSVPPPGPFVDFRNQVRDATQGHRKKKTNSNLLDQFIEHLPNKLSTKWRKLGRKLGFSDPELDRMKKDNTNSEDITHEMLRGWKERNGTEATCDVLIDALEKAERKDLADEFKDILKEKETIKESMKENEGTEIN